MNLVIITKLKANPQSPEFHEAFQKRPYFKCPEEILVVHEGTRIWSDIQIEDAEGNGATDYDKLVQRLVQICDTPDGYFLIHDGDVVAKLKDLTKIPHLAFYGTRGIGETKEYRLVGDAVLAAGNGQRVGHLVQDILYSYFLLPDFQEAQANLIKRFAFGSPKEPDFDEEICTARHPVSASFGTITLQLREVFERHLPEYRKTPHDSKYHALDDLTQEVRNLSF